MSKDWQRELREQLAREVRDDPTAQVVVTPLGPMVLRRAAPEVIDFEAAPGPDAP